MVKKIIGLLTAFMCITGCTTQSAVSGVPDVPKETEQPVSSEEPEKKVDASDVNMEDLS